MNNLKVWQGTDELILVNHNYPALVNAQEISVYIDSSPQIVKTLGDGVSNVSAESYLLTIAAQDTIDIPSGEYEIQAKILTQGGSELFGRIMPRTVRVRDTVFTDTE